MTESRCEPPAELRGADGWHWIQRPEGRPLAAWWWRAQPKYPEGFWATVGAPKQVAAAGYIYKFPVSPHDPADIAALVRVGAEILTADDSALTELKACGWPADARTSALTEKLRTALAAFPQPKDT